MNPSSRGFFNDSSVTTQDYPLAQSQAHAPFTQTQYSFGSTQYPVPQRQSTGFGNMMGSFESQTAFPNMSSSMESQRGMQASFKQDPVFTQEPISINSLHHEHSQSLNHSNSLPSAIANNLPRRSDRIVNEIGELLISNLDKFMKEVKQDTSKITTTDQFQQTIMEKLTKVDIQIDEIVKSKNEDDTANLLQNQKKELEQKLEHLESHFNTVLEQITTNFSSFKTDFNAKTSDHLQALLKKDFTTIGRKFAVISCRLTKMKKSIKKEFLKETDKVTMNKKIMKKPATIRANLIPIAKKKTQKKCVGKKPLFRT
jgi:hypothetical protein